MSENKKCQICNDMGVAFHFDRGFVPCPRGCERPVESAPAEEGMELSRALSFVDGYDSPEYKKFMSWLNYPGGLARFNYVTAKIAIAFARAEVVRQLEAAFQKYSEAMATANGRWSEWGDRAESTAEKLQELGEMLEAAIRKQIAEGGK